MCDWRLILILSVVLAAASLLSPEVAVATPFYAMNSANTCDTCHVEPIDWANPPTALERECTLDCQSCHVSPSGGGMRTQMGKYFAAERLSIWGRRPSAYGKNPPTPEDERRRYNALYFNPDTGAYQGGWLGGWAPGDMDYHEDERRYGYFKAEPGIMAGGDLRLMMVVPTEQDSQRQVSAFPMQAPAYLAVNFLKKLTAYLDIGWQGSQSGLGGDGDDEALELVQRRLWVREAFLMADRLPLMSYVRFGRFTLPYGWRLDDHTAYIRKGMFDQFRQAYGAEVGFAPNFPSGIYPWANLAAYRQGIEGWPGEPASTRGGWGVSGQGGLKELGYTIGLSFNAQANDDETTEYMVGPMWGVNLHPTIAYAGEFDYRRQVLPGFVVQSIFTYQEVQYMGFRGVIPKVRYEGMDPNVVIIDDHLHRAMVGVDIMPHRFLEVELAWRHQWAFDRENSSELLLQLHAMF